MPNHLLTFVPKSLFMKYNLFVILLFVFGALHAQDKTQDTVKRKSLLVDHSKDKPKARYDQYRIVTLQNDTTYVDTSLTIKKLYKFNYLRKDIFGLLPFSNEGQTYNTLDFGLNNFSSLPEMGFLAKHFSFYNANQINYYSVATPLTELYYKSVMEQGQTVDALITMNTSERLNFSVSFKGLRSLGKYINQLSSTGNFVFTSNYRTKQGQYGFNAHYTGQDILNNENGGITTPTDFESGNPIYKNRASLNVFQKDATSFLKGKRLFLDHFYRLNATKSTNNIYVLHQFNYENKFFEYAQPTIKSTVNETTSYSQFGNAYVLNNLKDQTHYNKMYNKVGVQFENQSLGKLQVFAEDFRDNFYYQKVIVLESGTIPSVVSHKINTLGGQYDYRKTNGKAHFQPVKPFPSKLFLILKH